LEGGNTFKKNSQTMFKIVPALQTSVIASKI